MQVQAVFCVLLMPGPVTFYEASGGSVGEFEVALVVLDEGVAEHSGKTVDSGIPLRSPTVRCFGGPLRGGLF